MLCAAYLTETRHTGGDSFGNQSIFKRDQPTNNMCGFVESYIFAVNAETLLTSLMSSFIKLQELMPLYTNLHSLPER